MPPSPSTSVETLRPDLGGSFESFDLAMDRMGFVGHQVLPVTDVDLAAHTFGKIPIEQLLQTRDTLRAPGGGYARGGYTFTTDSYATQEHGAEEPVDDASKAMYKHFFDAEVVAVQRAYDAVLRNAEIRAAALIFNATIWTGAALTTAITHEWDDTVNAVPCTDILAARRKIWDGCGLDANALVLNLWVFRNLQQCAQIIERIHASGSGDKIKPTDITPQMLAQVLDMDHVFIGRSAKNTAIEGQSASISPIWSGEYAMVCKVAESQDFREPCIGRTFHWTEDGSEVGGVVEEYRDPRTRGDMYRVRHQVDEKRLYTEAGHLLSNVTT